MLMTNNEIKKEIYDYCKTLFDGEIICDDNTIIAPYELSFYIPQIKAAIQFNGLVEHPDYYSIKTYQRDRTDACKEKGIRLLQIFEDEYVQNKDIVLNKIKHILKKCENMPKIMGRKCDIREIDKFTSKAFLNKYHIQGFVASSVYLGAYYNNELIAVMQFKEEEKGNNRWELTRFASNYNYVCQGVGGKLFKYFTRKYNPIIIKSFADRRWTVDESNNVYLQLGFKFDYYTIPDYHYFKESDGIIRQHKFNFRKQILHKKYGLDLSLTETQMVAILNYERIYDCGLIKYVWKNPDLEKSQD